MNVRTAPPRSARVSVDLVDGVADVRLDRPDKLNALDPAMFDALVAAGERLKDERALRAVVLSGAGRGFCSGLDKASFAAMAGGDNDLVSDLATRTHGIANKPQQAVLTWRDLPVPVIAAVHGVALGGGFQIMLGADIRYVAPDARLSVLEVKWGLVPDMAGIALMRELARADVIKELAFTGRMFSGAEAVGYGLATAVHDDPHAAAMRTAREIAGRSPDAVRAIKRLDAVLLTVGNNHMEERPENEELADQFDDYDGQLGVSYSDCSVDGLKLTGGPNDLEENQLNEEFCLTSETSQIIVDTIESDFPNNFREGESLLSEPNWLEGDHALALWVKVILKPNSLGYIVLTIVTFSD